MSSCHRGVHNKAVNTSCSYQQKATNLNNKQQLSKSHFLVKKSYGSSLAIGAVWHRSLMALWLKQDWGASIMKIMTCHISYLTNSRKLHFYFIRKGRRIQSKFAMLLLEIHCHFYHVDTTWQCLGYTKNPRVTSFFLFAWFEEGFFCL